MTGQSASIEVAPGELGGALCAVRLRHPEAEERMQLSLSKVGQLTPVQAWRTHRETGAELELFDGLKRWQAARALSWPKLRVEVHALDAAGAKVRLMLCNVGLGLSPLEEAWVVRSLYREDKLDQPHIAQLLGHDKSWVCRKLTLAEELSDELTASVRLGLPKTKPHYLRPDEIGKILLQLDPRWVPIFATAFFTGMRKGELLALKKIDVDMTSGTITVRRSNNFDSTKGESEEELPIANELRPYIERALAGSKTDLVFPRADGTQHPPDLPLQRVLRRAMGRAGIVDGYVHLCRRKNCGFKETRETSADSTCPRCWMKLWVKPIPRQLRFHDTRHSTAALLLKAKVPLAFVQKVMRHSDPAITSNVYGNIGLDDLRDAVNLIGDLVKPHLRLVAVNEVIDVVAEPKSGS